jgi:tetratricopeptide (TPR) repeat protein
VTSFDKQLERNLKGIELEKLGKVDEAIEQYERNIEENFDGNHPYDRLSMIYRKKKDIINEIRVLVKAIYVFENIVYSKRSDRLPKLNRFKDRLKKVRSLIKL